MVKEKNLLNVDILFTEIVLQNGQMKETEFVRFVVEILLAFGL